jgi:hypothetical protein
MREDKLSWVTGQIHLISEPAAILFETALPSTWGAAPPGRMGSEAGANRMGRRDIGRRGPAGFHRLRKNM